MQVGYIDTADLGRVMFEFEVLVEEDWQARHTNITLGKVWVQNQQDFIKDDDLILSIKDDIIKDIQTAVRKGYIKSSFDNDEYKHEVAYYLAGLL